MRSVFITGGTTGIGMELAKLYVSKGWRVGVCGRDVKKFDESFMAYRDNVTFYAVDVADRTEIKAAIQSFSKSIGLDLLIANAGIGYQSKSKVPNFEHTYRMVHVNLLGVLYAIEAAMDIMIPQGKGHLAVISSLAGYNGLPGVSGYSATKAAVLTFAESLNIDLRKYNIDVTTICPGFVETPLTSRNNHSMPFLMKAPKAAKLIARAIQRKKMHYAFPFLFSTIVRILSMLPRTWYRFIITKKALNYSKD